MSRQEINSTNQSFARTGIYRFIAALLLQTRFKSVSFDDERAAFNTKRIGLSFKYSRNSKYSFAREAFQKSHN